MKTKTLAAVLAAVLCLGLLAGCGSGGGATQEEPDIDLTALWTELATDNDQLPATVAMNEAALEAAYPGLTELAPKQAMGQMAMISAVAFEVAAVQCECADQTAAVKEIFDARIAAQIEGGAFYPATIEAWESAQVVTQGSYVLLLCGEGSDAYLSAFQAAYSGEQADA
jgi:outer membrane murein-binding lipoprotein Lpp